MNDEEQRPILSVVRLDIKDPTGRNLLLCLHCEADPEVKTSFQAIGILAGTSVCRKHMEAFLENQPYYFAGPDVVVPLPKQ